MRSRRRENGAILIISLWILVILSMLAIGIGHKLSLEIRLLHNHLDSVKAFYIAKAGVLRAVSERSKLLQKQEPIYADSFNQSWLNNEELFKDVQLGDGSYTVQNPAAADIFGMADEQARININTDKASQEVLKALLKGAGINDDTQAEALAGAIVSWRLDPEHLGFVAIEELLLVEGMPQEIFEGLRNHITIYGSGIININTSDEIVLGAVLEKELADYVLGVRQAEGWFVDAENYYNENPGQIKNIGTDAPDSSPQGSPDPLLSALKALKNEKVSAISSAFRINSTATVNRMKRSIEAVVKLENDGQYKFLFWRQQ